MRPGPLPKTPVSKTLVPKALSPGTSSTETLLPKTLRPPTAPLGLTPASATTDRIVGSPLGPVTLIASGGALIGVLLEGGRYQPRWWSGRSQGEPRLGAGPEQAVLDQAEAELAEYFAGTRERFTVPLTLAGSPFQRRVWDVLTRIEYGRTVTYRDLAVAIGQPAASRAVGGAVGRNPISVLVPCHRVLASDGSLGGYNSGLDRKRLLLAREGCDRTCRADAVGALRERSVAGRR